MSLRFATAIVLTVLIVALFGLARLAFRRWRYPKAVRRRDLNPNQKWVQRRKLMAQLRRVHRGLRLPTLDQKKDHTRFLKLLRKHANMSAGNHNKFAVLRKLAAEAGA